MRGHGHVEAGWSGRDRRRRGAGDESAFAARVECYGRELQVHCYRLLGSFEDDGDPTEVRLSALFAPGKDSLVIYSVMLPLGPMPPGLLV